MKIGLRAHDFGRMKPCELAKTIKKAGFETAQLALTKAITGINSFADVDASTLEQVRRAFDDNSIEIGVLGCYVEIGLPDRDARLQEVEKFFLGLEHAKELGVKLVGTETTHFPPGLHAEREPAYQNLKDSVLRMVERAEKSGVNIGIEPVADHTLNSSGLTRRLLDEVNSERIMVIFDPVNLLLTQSDIDNQDEIFTRFLEAAGPNIAALHVKDIALEDGEKKWCNIGKGVIRYEPIFKWLKENKTDMPQIPVLREHVDPENFKADIEEMRRLAVNPEFNVQH